jgi:hypothetical protein
LIKPLQVPTLDINLAADELRRERPAHKRSVALGLLRGNLQGHSAESLRRPRWLWPYRKSGRAARQGSEL